MFAAMTPSTAAAIHQPMPFGTVKLSDVRDPIIEPLWVGRRVLARIGASETAALTDEDGDEIVTFVELRTEITAASLATTLIVDGYLTEAIRDTTGVRTPDVADGVASPGQFGRQMILGGGGTGQQERRDRIEASIVRRAAMPDEAQAAFVAIDLLELEGEDLLDVPLLERKRLLESALGESTHVRRTTIVRPPPATWYGQWLALGFHQMAFKAANGRYTPGVASRDWAIGRIPKR
jgi:hypothetical protein